MTLVYKSCWFDVFTHRQHNQQSHDAVRDVGSGQCAGSFASRLLVALLRPQMSVTCGSIMAEYHSALVVRDGDGDTQRLVTFDGGNYRYEPTNASG